MTTTTGTHDLRAVPIHLGLGARAVPVTGWAWSAEQLAAYEERFASDGPEGRLVMIFDQAASWDTWEQHPAGEEVVVLLSGRADLIQEVDGRHERVPMSPGEAVVNPAGVWHTADVHEPGAILTITSGFGTTHRPRST
jgi:mannose-6-phosphate isomerase-like protein (cupin superfamily)